MKKLFSNLFALAVLATAVFVFRVQLLHAYDQLMRTYLPCRRPIAYSIGTFDERFGISEEDFKNDIKIAEGIWELSIGKNLFEYSPDGPLKINLVYDNRQQTTESLKEIGAAVDNTKASYEKLQRDFQSAKATLDSDTKLYDAKKEEIERMLKSYNDEVAGWNAKGGAPRSVYADLNAKKSSISGNISELDTLRKKINSEVDGVNVLVSQLNSLGRSLNLNVESYNTAGENLGQFEEGVYKRSSTGEEIDVYQFSDSSKLVRVLAHELGHALGLEHVTDPDAIMYYLNESGNDKPSASDLSELKTLCHMQ